MILGVTEDFSSDVVFDAQLTAVPESGLYVNEGGHPSVTTENLLSFLPFPDVAFDAWAIGSTYGAYETNRKRANIVTYSGKLYQSLIDMNLGNQPDTSPNEWLETNIESLKLKNFIWKVVSRCYSELAFTKRLINNQFVYNQRSIQNVTPVLLPNNYAAVVFEAKGSDYIRIKLNQVCFQKSGTTPVSLYVVNENTLVTTLSITPSNGMIDFKDLNYTFSGRGRWLFAIDSTEVVGTTSYVDPLKYDGFVCYTANGTGGTPASAKWNYQTNSIGIGFNVSVYLDPEVYIANNFAYHAGFVRAMFEKMFFDNVVSNSSNRGNRQELIQGSDEADLKYQLTSFDGDTIAYRLRREQDRAISMIKKVFDTQLLGDYVQTDSLEIEQRSL